MKSKFLFIYTNDKKNLPSESELIKKLKCIDVIKLSDNHKKLREINERLNYSVDSLESIYSLTCGKWCHYSQQGWGINCTESHKSIFYVTEDAKIEELTWDILKEKFYFKAFLIDEDEVEAVEELIIKINKISRDFKKSYNVYKNERKNIIEIINNEKFHKHREIFKDIELQEQAFLDDCKLFSDSLIAKIGENLNHEWT
jgi:hypothetical protein